MHILSQVGLQVEQQRGSEVSETRNSCWPGWGKGGLKGGMKEGEPIQKQVRVGEEAQHASTQLDSDTGKQFDLDYRSEQSEPDKEPEKVGRDDLGGDHELERAFETEAFPDQIGPAQLEESEAERTDENSVRNFLNTLDKNFLSSPRLIMRGEYEGISNGAVYKLIVRRKTEGTYVDWGLFNMKTKKQILLVRGEMNYPYNLEKQRTERRKTYGRSVKGGWAWEGYGYGYCNLHGLSDWFRKDPRVLHVDILEALFYDDEVHYMYHVCGPNCKNVDKSVGVWCTEGKCGQRVWSIRFTTFTTTAQEHELRPTSFSKEEKVQEVFMSLVRFFDGQLKVVIHRDKWVRRCDKEVIWLNPVQNPRFNDSVAGVDRNQLEKARRIFGTSVPRHVSGKSDGLDQVGLSNVLFHVLLISNCAQIISRTGYFILTLVSCC